MGILEFIQSIDSSQMIEYYLFNEKAYRTPFFTGRIANQNLHGLAQAEYIIISHENFLAEAERLLNFIVTMIA